MLVLSDVFVGKGGYFQWMLSEFIEQLKLHAGEDLLLLRYVRCETGCRQFNLK
jgi:hypothetical protein